MRLRIPCLVLIVIVAFLLSACTAQATSIPTSTLSPIETSIPPTAIPFTPALPTFTPDLPPTNTPEPTATHEPTEIPKVKLSADIDAPASVPWEDLTAGRIEPAEPVVFADDAQFEIRYNEDGTQRLADICHIEQLGASLFLHPAALQ